jgi:hypothetical protein
MTKYKKGTILKSKTSDKKIEIVSKMGGNGHYTTRPLNKNQKSHHIHYGTLDKFYEVVE